MDDFADLTNFYKRGINVCLDFVMVSYIRRSRMGKTCPEMEKEYRSQFRLLWQLWYSFFIWADLPEFPYYCTPTLYWLEDVTKHVMTTFYPYVRIWITAIRLFTNEMIFPICCILPWGVDIRWSGCCTIYLETFECFTIFPRFHHCTYHAYGLRDCTFEHTSSRRSCYGSWKGLFLLWNCRKTRMPSAVQCNLLKARHLKSTQLQPKMCLCCACG